MPEYIRPEFIRLPEPRAKDGPRSFCPYTGMSRSGLYNLTVPCAANDFKPPVRAKLLRKTGNLRGIWLIPYEPLIAHLNALPEGEEPEGLLVEAGPAAGARRSRGSAGDPSSSVRHGAQGEPATAQGVSAAHETPHGRQQRRNPARRSG